MTNDTTHRPSGRRSIPSNDFHLDLHLLVLQLSFTLLGTVLLTTGLLA